jgi:hypothetical protein
MKTLIQFIKEKVDMTKPGWMLKADPELAKKIQAKKDLEKKRQDSYGDPSKGISVRKEENAMSKPKKPKKKQDRPDPGYTYNADDLGIGLPTPKKQRNTRKGGHSYSANDL